MTGHLTQRSQRKASRNADMKRLPEAVTTKFTGLFAVLHSATDNLKMTAAEACLTGDFSQLTVINE